MLITIFATISFCPYLWIRPLRHLCCVIDLVVYLVESFFFLFHLLLASQTCNLDNVYKPLGVFCSNKRSQGSPYLLQLWLATQTSTSHFGLFVELGEHRALLPAFLQPIPSASVRVSRQWPLAFLPRILYFCVI